MNPMKNQFKSILENKISLLLLGVLLLFLAHTQNAAGIAGILVPVPFLGFLKNNKGFRNAVLLFAAVFFGWGLNFLKIVTEPIPWPIAILFALPVSITFFAGLLVFSKINRSELNQKLDFLLFPTLMTLSEYLISAFTPFASWGHAGYSLTEVLPLVQFASVTGIYGVSFIVYLVGFTIYKVIYQNRFTQKELIPIAWIFILFVWGSLRITHYESQARSSIKVASVGTESTIGGPELPAKEERDVVKEKLFAKSKQAFDSGVKVVVWNEAATGVLPEEESKWLEKVSKFAKENMNEQYLYAAYVTVLSTSPFKYENKYLLFNDKGEIIQTYFKHEPVPGEPAVRGSNAFEIIDTPFGNFAGAICYDLDFPYLGNAYGKLKTDILFLPASDWRGIDPVHTQMAAFRSVENGYSLLRSTRWGLSAGIDPIGRMRSKSSHFESSDRIMLVDLPKERIETLYSRYGDWFIYLLCAFVIISMFPKRLLLSTKK